MSDMYIDVDVAVALLVNLVGLTDDTDFKTRETAIAYNATGMDLIWKFTTTAGVVTKTSVTPTTAGLHDWTHVDGAFYKVEIPATGGTINNDTEGYGSFSGICDGVLHWSGPIYTFRAAAINNALVDGGDILDVNVQEISDDSGAADNLESMLDGTGGVTLSLDQLSIVASDGNPNILLGGSGAADGIEFTRSGAGDPLDAVIMAQINAEMDTAIADATLATTAALATVDTVVDAIRAVTDVLPDSGTLTTINTATARLTAVRAAVLTDWIDGERLDNILDAIRAVTDVTNNLSAADVNAQVSDVIKVDTITERVQGQPPAEPTFEEAIIYLYMMLRNNIDIDSGFKEFYNDAGAVIWKKALSDDDSNYDEAKGESGP